MTFSGTNDGLIFTRDYKKKPAYDSLAAVFLRAQENDVKSISKKAPSSIIINQNGSFLKVNLNSLNTGKASFMLYTMNGNLVKESSIQAVSGQNSSYNFNVSNIANGFYLAKIFYNKDRLYQSKIMILK